MFFYVVCMLYVVSRVAQTGLTVARLKQTCRLSVQGLPVMTIQPSGLDMRVTLI